MSPTAPGTRYWWLMRWRAGQPVAAEALGRITVDRAPPG